MSEARCEDCMQRRLFLFLDTSWHLSFERKDHLLWESIPGLGNSSCKGQMDSSDSLLLQMWCPSSLTFKSKKWESAHVSLKLPAAAWCVGVWVCMMCGLWRSVEGWRWRSALRLKIRCPQSWWMLQKQWGGCLVCSKESPYSFLKGRKYSTLLGSWQPYFSGLWV